MEENIMEEKVKISERFKNAMGYRLSFIDWIIYTIMFALISLSVLFFTIMIMLLIWPMKNTHNSMNNETTVSKVETDFDNNAVEGLSPTQHIENQINSDSSAYFKVSKGYDVYVEGGGSIHVDPDMIIIDYNGHSETLTDILKLKDEGSSSSSSSSWSITGPYLEEGQECMTEGEMETSSIAANGMYFSTQYTCYEGHWKELIPQ